MLFVCIASIAQKKFSVYAIGFYNQENLFDTCHDAGKYDQDFLPTGSYHWDGLKYSHKLHNMARALADMGTRSHQHDALRHLHRLRQFFEINRNTAGDEIDL